MSDKRVNIYRCSTGHTLVTKDRDDGCTPMMVPCQHCSEAMVSTFYRCDQTTAHSVLWCAPSKAELSAYLRAYPRKGHAAICEHVASGGLIPFQASTMEPVRWR